MFRTIVYTVSLLMFSIPLRGEETEIPADAQSKATESAALPSHGGITEAGEAGETGFVSPDAVISLAEALKAALARNPELAGYQCEVQAQDGAVLQAGIMPNPEAELVVEEFGGSGSRNGFHSAESTFQVSQLIQTAEKRKKNQTAARRGREVSQWEYRAKRLDLMAEVSAAFAEVLALQEKQVILEQSVRIAEDTCRVMTAKVTAGKAPLLEQTRADVAMSLVKMDRERVGRSLQAARSQLAALWGGKSEDFHSVRGEFYRRDPVPDREVFSKKLATNPELNRWDALVKQRQAAVEVEQAKRFPDVTVMAGVQNFQDEPGTAMMAGFSVPLPLWDRNPGGIAESQAYLKQGFLQAQAARIQLETAVERAYQDLMAAQEQVVTLEQTVITGAEQAFQTAQQGYTQGKFGSLDVLDAQRTLFEARVRHIDAVLDWHRAMAELVRLAAIPPMDGEKLEDTAMTGDQE